MKNKRLSKLFTPGPVNIPNRVAAASSAMVCHHRSTEFSAMLAETLDMLKPLFGTSASVLPVHATGRGALEGAYRNLFAPDDNVVILCNGSFGEMIKKTLDCTGIPYTALFPEWDREADLAALEECIIANKATGIICVHSDTSNAVANPVGAIGAIARKHGLYFVVDAVSSIGCIPFKMDEWGVDIAVTSSQKGLMSPAGIAFAAVSPRALERCWANSAGNFYINYPDIQKTVSSRGETPGSTPVSLIAAVNEALHMIMEEGLENVYARHKRISEATKAAVEKIGLTLFPANAISRSDALTVCKVPDTLSAKQITSLLSDRYNLSVSRGLGAYGDSLLRISNIGHCYEEDMLQFLAALEAVLMELGTVGHMGTGLESFIRTAGIVTSGDKK